MPEWWLHGYEYGIQRANTSPNATLLRRVGEGVNPLMIMTGDKSARLDLSKAHAFGEQGYAVIEPSSRGGSSFEVSEQVLHLFSGTLNSIYHQLVSYPTSEYVCMTRTRSVRMLTPQF